MAVALNVDIFDDEGEHLVRHVFFGETEDDAEEKRDAHAAQCLEFSKAIQEDRTYEFTEEVGDIELPDIDDYEEEEDEEEEAE